MKKKQKNNLFVLFYCFCLLILLIVLSDYCVYHFKTQDYIQKRQITVEKFKYIFLTKNKMLIKQKRYLASRLKKEDGLEFKNNKHAIVIFGCSFAYGTGLKERENLSYKLSQYLKTISINRALPWCGFQEMWYQIAAEGSKKFYRESLISNVDTCLYIMTNKHYGHLYSTQTIYTSKPSLEYLNRKGELKKEMQKTLLESIFEISYTYRFITKEIKKQYIKNPKNKIKIINNITKYFTESKKELERRLGKKVNFIVLFYDEIQYEKELEQKLKENEIYVIKTKDLTKEDLKSPKYTLSKTDKHPNEAAWDLLTPLIAKEIKKIWKN